MTEALIFPKREVRLQVEEAYGLLVARWRWVEVVKALQDRHGLKLKTAERRVSAAYSQMEVETTADRARRLSMAREAAREEIRRLRSDIARADTARIRSRLSRVMLGWEVHLARLNGILLGRTDHSGEAGQITLVLGLPLPSGQQMEKPQ